MDGMPRAHGCAGAANVHGWTVCRGRMDAQERRMSTDGRYAAGAWTRRSGECPRMDDVIRYYLVPESMYLDDIHATLPTDLSHRKRQYP